MACGVESARRKERGAGLGLGGPPARVRRLRGHRAAGRVGAHGHALPMVGAGVLVAVRPELHHAFAPLLLQGIWPLPCENTRDCPSLPCESTRDCPSLPCNSTRDCPSLPCDITGDCPSLPSNPAHAPTPRSHGDQTSQPQSAPRWQGRDGPRPKAFRQAHRAALLIYVVSRPQETRADDTCLHHLINTPLAFSSHTFMHAP